MHGLSPEEEIDYWRERARRAEAEVEGLRRVVPLDQLPDASRKALIASVEREGFAPEDTAQLRWRADFIRRATRSKP